MTSWLQLTERGSVWLPGPARRHFQKTWPAPRPPAPVPLLWDDQDGRPAALKGTVITRVPRPQLPLRHRFHEWPSFPGSGLAGPQAARPNQRPRSAGAGRGLGSSSAWGPGRRPPCRAPSPSGRKRGGFFFFLISQTLRALV